MGLRKKSKDQTSTYLCQSGPNSITGSQQRLFHFSSMSGEPITLLRNLERKGLGVTHCHSSTSSCLSPYSRRHGCSHTTMDNVQNFRNPPSQRQELTRSSPMIGDASSLSAFWNLR